MPDEAPVIRIVLPSTAVRSERSRNGLGTGRLRGTPLAALATARILSEVLGTRHPLGTSGSRLPVHAAHQVREGDLLVRRALVLPAAGSSGERRFGLSLSPFAAAESGNMWYAVLRM